MNTPVNNIRVNINNNSGNKKLNIEPTYYVEIYGFGEPLKIFVENNKEYAEKCMKDFYIGQVDKINRLGESINKFWGKTIV